MPSSDPDCPAFLGAISRPSRIGQNETHNMRVFGVLDSAYYQGMAAMEIHRGVRPVSEELIRSTARPMLVLYTTCEDARHSYSLPTI